jgi:tetratricopeptide (TPR) repeat protein
VSLRRIIRLALVFVLVFADVAGTAAIDVDLDALDAERTKKIKRLGLTERTEKRLNIALKHLETDEYEEAGYQLRKLSFQRMNPYERALVSRLLAQIAFAGGEPDAAIEYFGRALDQEVLSVEDDNSIRFNIAQLQIAQERWQEAVGTLDEWFRYERTPNPLGYYLKAIALYNLKEYDAAAAEAQRAIELSDEPREGWLQLLLAVYTTQEDFARARPVLEELLTRFPKKSYWVQLSLIYGASDDYHESLAVQQLAYAQGLLDEDAELQRLARSYLYHEMPFQAAQVLQRGLAEGKIEESPEVLELLGNSWIAAREYERALAPLERAAALSETGKLYVRLGQVLIQRESWGAAVEQLEKALDKGGLEDEGSAKLLLAVALYSDGRTSEARTWFARAAEHDSTREQGRAWIAHIDRELANRSSASTAAGAPRSEATRSEMHRAEEERSSSG